jgi:hypothetical protein
MRLLILAALIASPASANDKAYHALAGTAVYAATGSVGACLAAGVAKEALDATGAGTVEAADVVATVLPCLVLHALRQRPKRAVTTPAPEVDRAGLMEWANERGWR